MSENEMLRERIAKLEELLCGKELPPVEFRLTGSEAVVFGLLLARGLVSKEAVMAALYYNLGKEEAEPKIADVFICKLRRKLKPFDIEIATRWGAGWEMTLASKNRARELMAQSAQAA